MLSTIRIGDHTSIQLTERLAEAGIQPSVEAVGNSYDNALAETINGPYKTELIKPHKPWRTIGRRCMTEKNSGPAEGVKGVVEDVKGKAKEAVGTVAGRDDMVREGKAQQD